MAHGPSIVCVYVSIEGGADANTDGGDNGDGDDGDVDDSDHDD